MVRICLFLCLLFLTQSLNSSARASGCCYETKQWKIAQDKYDGYSNSVVLVPGNDTRVNLLLLITDRNRTPGLMRRSKSAAPKREDSDADYYYSNNELRLFKWWPLIESLAPFPGAVALSTASEPDLCDSPPISAFRTAVAASQKVQEADKARLIAYRQSAEPTCKLPTAAVDKGQFAGAARQFALYSDAAQAFNQDDEAGALQIFAQLRDADDPWVKETATYMVARGLLRMVAKQSNDEYGGTRAGEQSRSGTETVKRAKEALQDYLQQYPEGRYALSARGLFRRLYWLAGDMVGLSAEYGALFALRDPAKRGISDVELAQEIDNKLFGGYELHFKANETRDPILLAVLDLANMRANPYAASWTAEERADPRLTRKELEAQRPAFANEPALFEFLLASHAFYVGNKPDEVLTLIPDAARQERFSALEFSRQMLRGLALDATRDRNAARFWRTMVAGATQPYQREALEIAIAMSAERRGDVASLFATDTPIHDPFVRKMILAYVAGPDLLRRQAANKRIDRAEREMALFTLLYKDLAQKRHKDFLRDVALITPDIGQGNHFTFDDLERDELRTQLPALEKFLKPYGLFACPALPETIRKLAAAPNFAAGQLCVSEFMRVHHLFNFLLDTPMPKDQLGGGPSQFPGQPYSRLEAYKAVIASPVASANDKAYALYRAVNCYDNSSNDCGGVEVELPQRAAWFRRLKRDYAATRWARMAEIYW